MNWTKENPQVDGLYWYRATGVKAQDAELASVSVADAVVTFPLYHSESDTAYKLTMLRGLWSGPIVPQEG